MKYATILLALSFAALLIGCTQQPSRPVHNMTQEQEGNVSLRTTQDILNMFKCGAVKSYEYQTNMQIPGINISSYSIYSVSSDMFQGRAAWMIQVEQEGGYTPGANATFIRTNRTDSIWIDKEVSSCLGAMENITEENGSSNGHRIPCQFYKDCTPLELQVPETQLLYLGSESVTVPAGTFNCYKYSGGRMTYWVIGSVPVPVKISYTNGASSNEWDLVNYST